MHSHVLLFRHGYGVKTAVTMKCFIDYSPPPNHATPIAVFLHPSTAVRFYPLLSYLSPLSTFLHNQGFLYFYTRPPFSFAIFFPQYGGGSLLHSIPSLASIPYTF